jgi:hypothetical protein
LYTLIIVLLLLFIYDVRQSVGRSAEINFSADFHDRAADEARLFQHQLNQIVALELIPVQRQLLETGAAEAEHVVRLASLEQRPDLAGGEGIFKKITVVYINLLLREKLPRFPAGGSFVPAIKIYFHTKTVSCS